MTCAHRGPGPFGTLPCIRITVHDENSERGHVYAPADGADRHDVSEAKAEADR